MLKFSIFLAKIKNPITPNYLIFLKKMKRVKKMKLLKQYNHYHYYNYAKEYEFSASSTPLFGFQRKNIGRVSLKKLYSDFSMFSKCLGSFGGEENDKMYCLEKDREWTAEIGSSDDESVDERAERFIQKFYEDMREQRKELSYVN